MTWDYWVHTTDAIRGVVSGYHEDLSAFEEKLENARGQQRRTIREEIRNRKRQLSSDLQANITDPVSQKLASHLIDDLSLWWFCEMPRKEDARREYISITRTIGIDEPGKLSDGLDFRPDFTSLPLSSWLGLHVHFELLTPWYSKDDRVFHVLDNPVRKDRVFGVPFMAASSWKGMLRWACRMQAGLRKHLEEGKRFEEWKDPDWILHLFGNEKGEEQDFYQGALVFYPTWFDKIDFEVINPHSRERRAGTQPIYYEVVPPGAKGTLYLLYAPWPGMKPAVDPKNFLPELLKAIEMLLTNYGISAKRTVGWGTAKIIQWQAFRKEQQPTHVIPTQTPGDSWQDVWQQIHSWFQGERS